MGRPEKREKVFPPNTAQSFVGFKTVIIIFVFELLEHDLPHPLGHPAKAGISVF